MDPGTSQEDVPHSLKRPRNGVRFTIGFISSHLSDQNGYTVWQGVDDTAAERGVSLVSFMARDLGSTVDFDAQGNVLYDLASPEMLDGVVVWTTGLTNYQGPDGIRRILHHFGSLPVVTLEGGAPDEIPRVLIDSYQPMHDQVVHLITVHGYRRIAFIRGPDATHVGARERYQAYRDALSESRLPIDETLVSPPTEGRWDQESGETAVDVLIDQRHLRFEAIAAVNDKMAIGAIGALRRRGVRVPGDVAVVGFDDEPVSDSIIPPLTTASLQGYEHARRATQMLLELLETGKVSNDGGVPPKVVIRQSCGCSNPVVARAGERPAASGAGRTSLTSSARRAKALAAIRREAAESAGSLSPSWDENILDSFFGDLTAQKPAAFLPALEDALHQVASHDGAVGTWANVVSALRRELLPALARSPSLGRAEQLLLQGQVLVGETAQLVQRRRILRDSQKVRLLDEISGSLLTTPDLDELMNNLARNLPRLGIPGCSIALYEDPLRPAETSRLIFAYDQERGRVEPPEDQRSYQSRQLLPEGILPAARPFRVVVEPLYFRDAQLGIAVFEAGPRDGPLYDRLRAVISSALHGALVLQRLRQSSAELARQHSILRVFMESVPDSIYFKDSKSRITSANRAYAARMRLPDPSMVVGKTDFDFFPEDLARVKFEQEQEIVRTGRPLLGIEEYDRTAGLWSYTTKMPLFDETGAAIGTFGISRNITTIKKGEEEKKLLQSMLLQAQKMDAIGQLAGGIAHDFNNILTGILGYASVLLLQMPVDDPLRRFVSEIQNASRRAAELTHGLLAFSRTQDFKPETVDLNDIIQRNMQLLPRMIGEQYELSSTLWREAVPVLADSVQMDQVLMNLATNSRDAMPNGGKIYAWVTCERLETPPTGLRLAPGMYAHVGFADTGSGMDPKTVDRIFEPFYTTKDIGKGTGLGLAIVWGILEQHWGGIRVESEAGKGTTFHFYLPLVRESAQGAASVEELPRVRGTETILVAEDDAMVRAMVRSALEQHGYGVLLAEDGDDALRIFSEMGARVDLAILDVVMPKRDARHVVEEIRKVRPEMKILFMSGYGQHPFEGDSADEQKHKLIRKPFTPFHLVELVRSVLDE
jgi:PAS domain S-box-containing protein